MSIDRFVDTESKSIVFIGDFNPLILQPYWLFSKNLIREEEARNANVDIMHQEVVKYFLDWVEIEVSKQRSSFSTSKSPYFDPMKDLCTSIYKILKETPITAVGINHKFEINLQNSETYYEFGNILSPLFIWEDTFNDPRLLQLEIYEKERKDGLKGLYRIKITPSERNVNNLISVRINDHYELQNGGNGRDLEIVKLLDDNWEASNRRAKKVITELLVKTNILKK